MIFFQFFFGPQIGLKLSPRALGGPGGHFPAIFKLFWGPGVDFFFRALGPYFFLLRSPLLTPYPGKLELLLQGVAV